MSKKLTDEQKAANKAARDAKKAGAKVAAPAVPESPAMPDVVKPAPPVSTHESVPELIALYPWAGNGWKLQRAVREARDKNDTSEENVKAIYVRLAGRIIDPETGR